MLRRFTCALIGLVSSSNALALTCAEGQKALVGLSVQDQSLEVEEKAYTAQADFIKSKPQLDGRHVVTGSFVSASGAYEQLWCKLKSLEALQSAGALSGGSEQDCRQLNALQLTEALAKLGASTTPEALGIALLADRDVNTGAEWAPAQLGIEAQGDRVGIQAARLKSPNWLPIIGGMNYCKLLSAPGATQLVKERLAKQGLIKAGSTAFAAPIETYQEISWTGGFSAKQSAFVVYQGGLDATVAAAKGTYIISPGAEIPPAAMSGLAHRLASASYLTLIVQYPMNTAILDTLSGHGNSAINLARKIKQAPQEIAGLSAQPLQGKPVYVIGHSLGGATLAGELYRDGRASLFDRIVLYGTASFVKFGGSQVPSSSPVTLLFGEHDGLSANDIPQVLRSFDIAYDPAVYSPVVSSRYPNISYRRLKGLNHFCIVSDQTAGNAELKKQDGAGLAPEACLDALAQELSL